MRQYYHAAVWITRNLYVGQDQSSWFIAYFYSYLRMTFIFLFTRRVQRYVACLGSNQCRPRASAAHNNQPTMIAAGGNRPIESHPSANLERRCIGLLGTTLWPANMLLGEVDRANGPQNGPTLWRRIIAATNEHFEGHLPYFPQPKPYLLDRGVFLDHSNTSK